MTSLTRRSALLGAAGLAAAALAGCGRSETPPGAVTSSGPALADGPATGDLTIWAMGAEGEKLPKLLEQFTQANPDANVQVTAIPWDSAYEKFSSSIAAGTTPDLAMVGTTWMGEFVGLDALDPTPDGLIDPSVFFSGAQGTTEVGGLAYAVPWYVETRMLFYRTDLAEKAGVTEAADWEGLTALARAMKDKAGAKFGINLQPGQEGSWQTVMPFAWSNGATITDEQQQAFTFDTPEMIEAVSYYQSFFNDGLANKTPAEGSTEADFVSGAVPMFISGPWMMSAVEEVGGEGFADKYDVLPIPAATTSSSFVGGSNLAVFKATRNRDAAWKLIRFLLDPATQVTWYQQSTDLPSVQAAWDAPELSSDARLAKFGEQLTSAIAPPAIATWSQVSAKFDAQIEQVCVAGTDPAAAMATVQSEATAIGTGV